MKRIVELDFLKGILILLVISFHLVYFEQLHPDIKQVVYAFHMPGFLLISGYLMNIGKAPKAFLRTLLWLAVPYLVMESGYILMASLLPINEHIDHLTPALFLDRLLLHPLGPYWYLHTLILCGAIYYIIYKTQQSKQTKQTHPQQTHPLPLPCREGRRNPSRWYLLPSLQGRGRGWVCWVCWVCFLLTAIAYYVLSHFFGMMTFSSALYFLAGAAIRQSGREFRSIFRASPFALLVFFLLAFLSESPNQSSIAGVLIAWSALSSLLWCYKLLPNKGRTGGVFLGRNTLPLYIFSPIFTFLCKRFVPYLQFDPTGLLFLMVSLACCVSGSLLIAWLMDLTGISRFFFGRKALSI